MTTVIKCTRCNRRLRNNTDGWNATMKAGVPVGYLCPDCQSPEENAEAEIREATTEYRIGPTGFEGRPKPN